MKIDFNQIVTDFKGRAVPVKDKDGEEHDMTLGEICQACIVQGGDPKMKEDERRKRWNLLDKIEKEEELSVKEMADLHDYVKPVLGVGIFGVVEKMLECKGEKDG